VDLIWRRRATEDNIGGGYGLEADETIEKDLDIDQHSYLPETRNNSGHIGGTALAP
jgi:hypothetical protein